MIWYKPFGVAFLNTEYILNRLYMHAVTHYEINYESDKPSVADIYPVLLEPEGNLLPPHIQFLFLPLIHSN